VKTKSNLQYGKHLYHELLVIRARRGDASAFEELVHALETPLFYYVRRLVGSEEDAWDILQEAWVKAYRNLGSLRETNRFRVWLYSISHKTAMSHQRGVYRKRSVIEDAPMPEMAEDPNDIPNPEDAERVHAALDRIELPFREVLTLHFLEDLSVEETAQIIGVPAGTVKSRLYYAKQALKKILNRDGNV
jgi:RNA polymerase sigma-70 factor (ECF subfamily)